MLQAGLAAAFSQWRDTIDLGKEERDARDRRLAVARQVCVCVWLCVCFETRNSKLEPQKPRPATATFKHASLN